MRLFSIFSTRRLALLVLLLSSSGCDFYLPTCGSQSILAHLREQTIRASGLEALEEVGMVSEINRSLKERKRTCEATIQPTANFVDRLNRAKSKAEGSQAGGLLGMLGKALVSGALPDRLGTATIQFQIHPDEQSKGFGIQIEDESLDQLSHLDTAYKLTNLVIQQILSDLALPDSGSDPQAK